MGASPQAAVNRHQNSNRTQISPDILDEQELVPTAQTGYDKDSGKTDKDEPAPQILTSSCCGQSDFAARGRLDRNESCKTKSY
jgi:hypothetical protein